MDRNSKFKREMAEQAAGFPFALQCIMNCATQMSVLYDEGVKMSAQMLGSTIPVRQATRWYSKFVGHSRFEALRFVFYSPKDQSTLAELTVKVEAALRTIVWNGDEEFAIANRVGRLDAESAVLMMKKLPPDTRSLCFPNTLDNKAWFPVLNARAAARILATCLEAEPAAQPETEPNKSDEVEETEPELSVDDYMKALRLAYLRKNV